MLEPPFQIAPVRTAGDLEATITIFRTYAASLDLTWLIRISRGRWP